MPRLWGLSPGVSGHAKTLSDDSQKAPLAQICGPGFFPESWSSGPEPPTLRTNPAFPHPTPQQHPLPETSLLSKGGGKPWAFRSDWSPPAARGEAAIGCRALSVAEARAVAGEAQPGSGAPAAAAAARLVQLSEPARAPPPPPPLSTARSQRRGACRRPPGGAGARAEHEEAEAGEK